MGDFKSFAQNLPPDMRGVLLSNSEEIKKAHDAIPGDTSWLKIARPIIQKRMNAYQKKDKSELGFNLMAIVRNLKERYQEQMDLCIGRRLECEQSLLDLEGDSTMDIDGEQLTADQCRAKIADCEAEVTKLRGLIADEDAKFQKWKKE